VILKYNPLALAIGRCLGPADFVPSIGTVNNVAGEGEVAASRGLCIVCGLEVLVLLGRTLAVVHAAGHRLGDGDITVRSTSNRLVTSNRTLFFGIGSNLHPTGSWQLQSLGVELLFHIDGATESWWYGFGGRRFSMGDDLTVLLLDHLELIT